MCILLLLFKNVKAKLKKFSNVLFLPKHKEKKHFNVDLYSSKRKLFYSKRNGTAVLEFYSNKWLNHKMNLHIYSIFIVENLFKKHPSPF